MKLKSALFVLFAALTLMWVPSAAAQQATAVPTPLPTNAAEVSATWAETWKAEGLLDGVAAKDFCQSSGFQKFLYDRLQAKQTLADALLTWFKSHTVDPYLVAMGTNYVSAFVAAQAVDHNVPSWTYPADAQNGIYIPLVIQKLGQTKQYAGCDTGTSVYGKHS